MGVVKKHKKPPVNINRNGFQNEIYTVDYN